MQTINVSELRHLLNDDNATDSIVIDVRTPGEYEREKIMGVVNMPLSEIDQYAAQLREYKHIYVHCASGNRSQQACTKLDALGLDTIVNVQGGIGAWKNAGFQTIENKAAPLPINQQVQITAGGLVVTGVVLSTLLNPFFIVISAFVGAGLMVAGATGTCTMGLILARMPWNRR